MSYEKNVLKLSYVRNKNELQTLFRQYHLGVGEFERGLKEGIGDNFSVLLKEFIEKRYKTL